MMKTMIVDGNNLLMRSVFATQHSGMSFQGVNTGPVTTFISSLAHLIRTERPTHLAVAWDSQGPGHRHVIDASYKGNRRVGPIGELKETSFPQARTFLRAAHIDQAEFPGYEADDVIAAWWRIVECSAAGDKIVIASSDKDFLQLVQPNPNGVDTELIRLSSADTPTDRWDIDRVQTEMGFEPWDWPKVTALTGDVADNVFGIPGIGPKKAVKLLARHDWDLERALEEHPEHREQVLKNFELVNLIEAPQITLLTPPPIDFPEPGSTASGPLVDFLARYGLARAMKQFKDGTLWSGPAAKKVPGKPLRLG